MGRQQASAELDYNQIKAIHSPESSVSEQENKQGSDLCGPGLGL